VLAGKAITQHSRLANAKNLKFGMEVASPIMEVKNHAQYIIIYMVTL